MYCDWPVLGRCCFCVPLRRGVIICGYVNILFNAFMIGLYSYTIHHELAEKIVSYGRTFNLPAELLITISCAEIIFSAILVYGAHMKLVSFIKAYYYFTLGTIVAMILLQIIDISRFERLDFELVIEILTMAFASICIQVYLVTIVRSLLKKLEVSENHTFENQLHQITNGEVRIDTGGIYNNTTAPAED